MNTSNGRLFYATGIDNSQLRNDAAESRNILHSIGQTAQQEGANMDAVFGRIAKSVGGIFAIGKAQEFAREIIKVRGEIESLEISFETLLGGNKEKASAMFSEIRQFAVQTPMMLKDLASGAQTMLGFNIEAERVVPMLKAIGDVSMGDAAKFNSLTLAFSQMSATGKLMGQDLLQMINAGFNPLAVISEKTGKTIGELKEEMEKGKITVEMVTEAFISATSAGGKYYGMLEKQSHGINGAVSNLQGAIDDLYNSIGEASQGVITDALDGATYLVKHYEAVAEILAVIVGTYGVYKGAVIANEAMIQAAMTAKEAAVAEAFEAEIAAITGLLPQKEAEAQTSLQQAVAAGHITEAKAAEIAMLRAEAQAQIEALAATEAAAQARLMASQDDVQTALKWEDEIKGKIRLLEEEADALFENGDSIAFNAKQEEIAALKSELLEVQKERETAVQEVNTAANEMNAASHQRNAIATAEESAAVAVNTAQTTTNTGATSALSIAKTKLTGVVRTLYATISAHPFALAAAAVAALGYGIYKLVTYESEAEKAQKRLSAAVNECEASIQSERIQIEVMFDRLRKAKEGTVSYQKAKDAIIQQYGKYLNGLSAEISSLKDVEGAYKAVTTAAFEAARARAMNAYVKKEGEEYDKTYNEQREKIYNYIKDKKGEAFAKAHMLNINDVISGRFNWTKDFLKQFEETGYVYEGEDGGYSYAYNPLEEITLQARKSAEDYAKTLQEAADRFGVTDEKKDNSEDTKEPTHNKAYWEKQKKNAEDELAALSDIEAIGKEGDAIRARIAEYNRKLAPYSVSSSGKSGGRSVNDVNQYNADLLANEAANRRKQEEEYAKQLADQVKDSEFDIRQSRIDAMKEGIDKELMQNQLNYDRLEEQNKRRLRDMLDNLADEQIRLLEDADPTMFKKKNKDGKWEEDPGKREEKYREIRAKLTIADLDPDQKAQVEEFGKIAALAFEKANQDSMEKMLQDVLTYEQQRTKIAQEYARKRADLYEKDADGKTKTDADGNPVFKKGATQGNLEELNRQETEALKAIDEQFAQREKSYQAWCESIANLSLKDLEKTLAQAKARLYTLSKTKIADIDVHESGDMEALTQALDDAKTRIEELRRDGTISVDGEADMEALTQALDDAKTRIEELRRDGTISVDGEADMEALTQALDDAKTRIEELRRDGTISVDGEADMEALTQALDDAKTRIGELRRDGTISVDGEADMEALTQALDDAKTRIGELRRDGTISVDGEADMEALTQALDDAKTRIGELRESGVIDAESLASAFDNAKTMLGKISDEESKQLIMARAMVNTAEAAVKKARAKNDTNPGRRTIKEWEDLYKTLNDVEKEFESIGSTVDGVVGEIVSECGSMASSTLQMINGIVTLANWSAISIKMTAEGASAAIQTMEKASVILTVISAAMQIATQVANLFNSDDKKQKEIDNLQERIDQLQWEIDHQEIGRVQAQYGTAIDRLNKALVETRLELAAGATGWKRFLLLSQQAPQSTELMQKTAEKLAQAYGNMAYTADKALGTDKYKQANDQLKNLAQQQILLQEQINAEASKKKTDNGAILEWQHKIEELGLQSLEIINEMVEDIIGDTSTGIAESLADAFIYAFQAGEDAAEAWGDKVNEIVADVLKRMMVSKFLEEPLGEIFDKYKRRWFKDGQFQGLDSVINSMEGFASDLNAVGADFADIWDNLPDSVKQMFKITSDAEREASQKGIASASQESVDELNGRATAIQSHTFSIMENTKLLLATTQSILKSVMNIEAETEGMGSRISRMEGSLKEVNDNIGDIVSKGIRLKN